MNKFEITIEGTTPLLMNKPPEYEGDTVVIVKNPQVKDDNEVVRKLYCLNGVIYTPATHIRGAMINAGKDLKVKGKGKATYSKLIASMVEITPEAIPHTKLDFDVRVDRTVNPNTKGMNMTKRPRLKEWELNFEIFAENEVPPEIIKESLDRAGKYVGIGDWRPATKGIHGKFMVTKFKKIK